MVHITPSSLSGGTSPSPQQTFVAIVPNQLNAQQNQSQQENMVHITPSSSLGGTSSSPISQQTFQPIAQKSMTEQQSMLHMSPVSTLGGTSVILQERSSGVQTENSEQEMSYSTINDNEYTYSDDHMYSIGNMISLPENIASEIILEPDTNIFSLMNKYPNSGENITQNNASPKYVLMPINVLSAMLHVIAAQNTAIAANSQSLSSLHLKLDRLVASNNSAASNPQTVHTQQEESSTNNAGVFQKIDSEQQLIDMDSRLQTDTTYRNSIVSIHYYRLNVSTC